MREKHIGRSGPIVGGRVAGRLGRGTRLVGCALALFVPGCNASAQAPVVGPLPTSVRYAFLSRSSPRPLQIHIVSIDLRDPGLSFSVVAA